MRNLGSGQKEALILHRNNSISIWSNADTPESFGTAVSALFANQKRLSDTKVCITILIKKRAGKMIIFDYRQFMDLNTASKEQTTEDLN